jgi:hypothetical protein
VNNKPEYACHGLLYRSAAHFSIALGTMWIADVEPGAGMEDWKEQGRPGCQVLYVEVPSEYTRWS